MNRNKAYWILSAIIEDAETEPYSRVFDEEDVEALKMAAEILQNLPSVTPNQRTGHWIDADGENAICSCCNRLNHFYGEYCKHCGAKMESEEQA